MSSRATRRVLTEMETAFLECRPGGPRHAWFSFNPPAADRGARVTNMGIREAFRCERCKRERHEVWSRGGKLLYRRYKGPEGFSALPRGITAQQVRKELLRRWEGQSPTRRRRT